MGVDGRKYKAVARAKRVDHRADALDHHALVGFIVLRRAIDQEKSGIAPGLAIGCAAVGTARGVRAAFIAAAKREHSGGSGDAAGQP